MEPFEHTTEVHLRWGKGPSIEEILPTLKKWQHLRRLTLRRWHERSVPPLVLLDFIMGMEHLTYLHLVPIYNRCDSDQLETLRDQVNNLVLPHRPNFQFDVSEIPSLIQSRNCLR
jgi:hypothetical protein